MSESCHARWPASDRGDDGWHTCYLPLDHEPDAPHECVCGARTTPWAPQPHREPEVDG